jgi:hypothetical protein
MSLKLDLINRGSEGELLLIGRLDSVTSEEAGKVLDELTERFMRLYIANGTVGMLREWVDKDCPVSSRKIAEMMYFLSRKISIFVPISYVR